MSSIRKCRFGWKGAWAMGALALIAGLAPTRGATAVPAPGASTTFNGRAKVVSGTVAGIPVVVCDSGELPSGGGAKEETLLKVKVTGLVEAKTAHAATVGQGDRTRTEAGIAKVDVGLFGNEIGVEFMMTRAEAVCVDGKVEVSGNAEFSCVSINGDPFDLSGEPNETFKLPNGKVIFNEQTTKVDGAKGEITVVGMRVIITGLADVAFSVATAGVTCGVCDCDGGDFITGGGWFFGTPTGSEATFALAGGVKESGALWGHFTYVDNASKKTEVQATSITRYEVVSGIKRAIEGNCKINGVSGFTFRVEAKDVSDCGCDDWLKVDLSNGYLAKGNLAGGQIELHVPCE